MIVDSFRIAVAGAVWACACGGDGPIRRSEPIPFALSVSSGDVDGDGTVIDRTAAASQTGDPWGAFIAGARDAISGEPSDVTLDAAVLTLEPSSVNVTDLAEIFHGPVSVRFQLDTTNANVDVAEAILDDAELGDRAVLSERFRFSDLAGDDLVDLLDGSFDIVFVGQTGSDFRSLGADADLRVTLTFSAFE